MQTEAPPCIDSTPLKAGLPGIYYPLHSLLHTLRTLQSQEDAICAALTDIQRTGKVSAGLQRELTKLLEGLPTAAFEQELRDIWSAL